MRPPLPLPKPSLPSCFFPRAQCAPRPCRTKKGEFAPCPSCSRLAYFRAIQHYPTHAPLVKPPARLDGDVGLPAAVEEAVQGSAGPLEDGGVGDVEAEACRGEELARLEGLLLPLLRQRHVAPSLSLTVIFVGGEDNAWDSSSR